MILFKNNNKLELTVEYVKSNFDIYLIVDYIIYTTVNHFVLYYVHIPIWRILFIYIIMHIIGDKYFWVEGVGSYRLSTLKFKAIASRNSQCTYNRNVYL